ncbi:flagellar filament capping protein FliD [Desulfovibrio fairfieldensis]|uniref:Filament cap protein n=1 Tax=Desulfovibrio fairfieldensis TaxID=44742 RepID=A0A0X8JL18_9BACT|nr:flagellar filament capping protein FliD [Desulfovibrio fairfieldensis]AMD90728.1 flagellar hook protein [Desulfovibrio fairfieldensis]
MAISISGSNAISGLSGNDTNFDKVLEQLKKIESSQLNRLEAWKGDWNLRYEAFGKIIEQVQAASSMLSALSDKNNFVTKNVSSSNENIITAVANASAQDVQHTIKVSQMASNAIWANTGCVFDSKTDIINDTGDVQYFRFNYAGKDHSIKVPAGTTLESFASMVNNSTENPGIKVSLIQTGSGYVYQVAGKDTGADNNLIIYNNNLKGMGASGTNSTWLTNGSLDTSQSLTNPTEYTYDLVLRNGAKKSVTVKGNSTADQLVTALNAAAGGINARLDADGNLLMDGVKSFSRRKSSDEAYTPPSTWVGVGSGSLNDDKLNAAGGMAEGKGDNDLLTFTMTMEDGSTREFKIKAGASKRELLVQMAQATQSGDSVDIGLNSAGSWGVNLSGVTNVACADLTDASKLQSNHTPAKGVRDELGGTLDSASATLTFAAGKLGKRIDGKDDETPPPPGSELVFTITKKDGSVVYVDQLTSGMTNQQLLDAINAAYPGTLTTDADGNRVLKLDDVKDFKLTTGASGTAGFTTTFEASTKVPKTNTAGNSLFYTDGTGTYLEEPPDLVYTVTTNNGETGTLTLTSPQTMKDVLTKLKDGTGIVWKDKDGNSMASAPADWGVAYTDADGKELTPDEIAAGKPVYLQLKNVQNLEGPALQGQVATSDNWTIQRSANARYTVDNWPMEMESASNSVSDVIEGVVFSIQNTGDAHISISTDITSVEQSIQNFLDAVNSVLLTVRDYTSYDEDKEVTSNDPDDIEKDNYSPSGLTNQKGGLLQGNYGVQLFKSRFSSVLSSSPPGFKSRQSADDILSGDVLASLANLGIKTDTDESSETYGLLVIAPKSGIAELQTLDKESYNDMITNNLEAVVDFFCASGTGSSTSADFRYGSHVEGITKAGNYEVKYHVETGSDGKPQITNVTIGGVEATRDESMPGNYFSVARGDARGLSIQIDDLSLGDHPQAGEEPMYVRIKQGLTQTVNSFFKDELNFTAANITSNMTQSEIDDVIALKSKNGALMSLRDNYKSIMENIDKKIEREQYRLETWEARQKTIFANLETLLKNYSEQQKTLESQLKQLSGND